MRAVFPGCFDPPTLGHLDIIERASRLFKALTVLVSVNPDKQAWLARERRVELLRLSCARLPNVSVDSHSGLLADYLAKSGAEVIVKGLRAPSDLEYEQQMAVANLQLGKVETLFLASAPQYAGIRSGLVREVYKLGGDISHFVPREIMRQMEREKR